MYGMRTVVRAYLGMYSILYCVRLAFMTAATVLA